MKREDEVERKKRRKEESNERKGEGKMKGEDGEAA